MSMATSASSPARSLLRLCLSLLTAAVLWFIMFSPWTSPMVPSFWWAMTCAAVVLTTLSATATTGFRSALCLPVTLRSLAGTLVLGVGIAVVLWAVFFVGDKLSQLIFPFARTQVDGIYGMKGGEPPVLIAALLLCVIGPAEELFWRGYVQHTLAMHFSANTAFVVTTLVYTLVHLPSGNFMLTMAAMVCGMAWGGLYRLMPDRLAAIVLSHALWDAAAFVWFPF